MAAEILVMKFMRRLTLLEVSSVLYQNNTRYIAKQCTTYAQDS